MNFDRRIVFDAVRLMLGRSFTSTEVAKLDSAITVAMAGAPRKISAAGLELIKTSEGLRLNSYLCPADVPTIGYGSTGPNVRMGMTITLQEAEDLLAKDLERFEAGVSAIGGAMTQGQFDALVSFAFNLGLEALKTSTLLRKHLTGDYAGAKAEFAKWVHGGGRILPGLVTRRAAEASLYSGIAS